MEAVSETRSPDVVAVERHGKLRIVLGGISLILFAGTFVLGPEYGIPLLAAAMGSFVLGAWHHVLYRRARKGAAR